MMTMAPDPGISFASLESLAAMLTAGQISSRELTQHYLDRIAALDEELHAFCAVYAADALRAAGSRDAERAGGGNVGALHGIPVAIKDIFDIAGRPTHAGSRALTDRRPHHSANAVRRLEAAGMVVIGRTHMVEFAFGGWGTNPVMGAPRNPWDRDTHRVAGGSSSGSAVSVAAGLVPLALGTDTGGSVRTPATWCGLIGVKTSSGLIGRGGVVPLCPTHDSVGSFSRTVRDAALVLDALQGLDSEDGSTAGVPRLECLADIETGVAGMRFGRLRAEDLAGVDADIIRLQDKALEALEALGARVEEVILPLSTADYLQGGGDIMSYESCRALGRYVEPETSPVDPVIRARIMKGRDIPPALYSELLEARLEAQRNYARCTAALDAVILPGCHRIAPPLKDVDETTPPNFFGRVVNFLDLAAVAAPTGRTGAGMPAGIQIAVRKFGDAQALRIARALEADRGGLVERPPGCAAEQDLQE